jgi:hypothetical protein
MQIVLSSQINDRNGIAKVKRRMLFILAISNRTLVNLGIVEE